jgi:hypothetical protein
MIGTSVRAPKPLQGSTQRSAKSVIGATLKATSQSTAMEAQLTEDSLAGQRFLGTI